MRDADAGHSPLVSAAATGGKEDCQRDARPRCCSSRRASDQGADVMNRADQSGQQEGLEAEGRCGADQTPEKEDLQHRRPATPEGEFARHVVVEEETRSNSRARWIGARSWLLSSGGAFTSSGFGRLLMAPSHALTW
jgi:hypothetical protein